MPSTSSPTPALNAVTGRGKVSVIQRYAMKMNRASVRCPATERPSGEGMARSTTKIKSPGTIFLNVRLIHTR